MTALFVAVVWHAAIATCAAYSWWGECHRLRAEIAAKNSSAVIGVD